MLDGKAATCIGGLSVSDGTYREAIKVLQSRNGQKDNAFASHLEKLYNLPAVKNMDIRKLRDMFDKIETHIQRLKSLGVATKQCEQLLIHLVQPKFPDEIQLEIGRKYGSDVEGLNRHS